MTGTYEYSVVSFENSLRAGYIDSAIESDSRYSPRFVANDRASATNLLSVIKRQLNECERFDFSVAFIAESGLQALIETLNMLRDKNIPGRFLTSTYLNFNSPAALQKLLEYPNIETRVYQGSMHAKGYFFNKGELSTVIIGSSNLTQTALTCNKEWNVLFHSFSNGEMLMSASKEFDALWEDDATALVTPEWIQRYEQYLTNDTPQLAPRKKAFIATGQQDELVASDTTITPNKMQVHALAALAELHDRNEERALLVSATGTGKTYLAALDVHASKPGRVLFLAHRSRILQASEESFRTVLGNRYTYGSYGAGSAKPTETCVFAMVSTLVRHLDEFDPSEFDYIIIDEAHRTGANSYQSIMSYLTPSFYLGMTATPSRTDGYDVFGLFNHVIAYRITLQDALENEMLAPFHYFGIADLEIDDETVDDPGLFSKLTSAERVRHVTSKIEEYSISKKGRRGLIFCGRNEEARALSASFNELGYRTQALSGGDSDDARNRAISLLENGTLEYIFTVDIFNEGIDIPSLNQIIMLRRTESAIVFLQQLGRGLRKTDEKEYTLVLDFIGNYQKNYLVPIALSGDRTYNKDNLRAFVKEGSTIIPGCSTISFDKISEARIFRAVDGGKFSETKLIRDEYENLKQVIGHIPPLFEFDSNESIDPLLIFKKFGSYHAFLARYEKDYDVALSDAQCAMLKFISQKIANGKRPDDLLLLWELTAKTEISDVQFTETVYEATGFEPDRRTMDSVAALLTGSFSSSDQPLVSFTGDVFRSLPEFERALQNEDFKHHVLEAIEFGLARNKELYANTYDDTYFTLYAKYTYEEVCKLLGWEKNINGQNIGGYKYDASTNTFPVFINYDKDPNISDTIRYEDRFLSDRELIAISKQPRYLDSPEIERLKSWPDNEMRTYLFVRKNKDDKDGGKEFYFLGEMFPTGEFKQITMPGTTKAAVEISYRLDKPVRADLFDYLTSDFDGDRD